MGKKSQKPKVLLIGWDAADWRAIRPLMEKGKMPALQRFLEVGVSGDISTLQPVLSPMLWSSIATGKRPYKHGVHGFSEPDPISGGIRPVTNLSRKTKAVWNILNQNDYRSNVVGWWPSNPAEPINGVMVSNDYQRAGNVSPDDWPMKPGTIHPESLSDTLAEIRRHPMSLNTADVAVFMPKINEMSERELMKLNRDRRIQSLVGVIADTITIHAAGMHLLDNEPCDFMAVYYDAIDHFGHGFMKYHPPQRKWISDRDFELYKDVIDTGYQMHDGVLAEYLAKVDLRETTVILISDHGFHPDDLRPWNILDEPAGPACEHRDYGIFAAAGPGIKQGETIGGASLLDICPTILSLFDLPAGGDMDGRPLLDIYRDPPKVTTIPSWDEVHEGDPGTHPPDRQIAPSDAKASIDQLVALGYIDQPNADLSVAVEETIRELNYNLAQAHVDGGNYYEAMVLFEDLFAKWHDEYRFGVKLANCYRVLRRTDELPGLVEKLIADRESQAQRAKRTLKKAWPRIKTIQKVAVRRMPRRNRRHGGSNRVHSAIQQGTIRYSTGYHRGPKRIRSSRGKPSISTRRITSLRKPRRAVLPGLKAVFQKQQQQVGKLQKQANPNLFSLRQLAAWADLQARRPAEALRKLADVDEEHLQLPGYFNLKAQAHFASGDTAAARAAYLEAEQRDPGNAETQMGLGRCALRDGDRCGAIRYIEASLAKQYVQPWGHHLLGLAHYRSGMVEQARDCFLTAADQSDLFPAPLRMLEEVYKRTELRDFALAAKYHVAAKRARQDKQAFLENACKQQRPDTTAGGAAVTLDDLPGFTTAANLADRVPAEEIITIVSGLPRSGTSMLMQMIDAAGIPPLTDGLRVADESNPKGYYEYEPAIQLQTNTNWLPEAKGKVIKIVAQLLPFLPESDSAGKPFHYRVIFLHRDLQEILTSQEKMLAREGRQSMQGDLGQAFRHQLVQVRQFLNRREIPAMQVTFSDTIHDPRATARELLRFLGRSEKAIEAVAGVVEGKLYRNISSG